MVIAGCATVMLSDEAPVVASLPSLSVPLL
jgi:hypothetical protein